jgi:hypothetical protein
MNRSLVNGHPPGCILACQLMGGNDLIGIRMPEQQTTN